MKKEIKWGSIPIIGLEMDEDLNKFPFRELKNIEHSANMKGVNNPNYGKIGALKGKTFSEEHRTKIGNKHKGKIVSEETRKIISENSKKLRHTEETKEICRQKSIGLNIGRKRTEEEKRKISEKKRGTKASEETKRILSEAQKKRKNHFSDEAVKNRKLATTKPILCYTYPEMIFVCEYESINEAARQLNRDRCGIGNILSGKTKEPRKFTFKYKN